MRSFELAIVFALVVIGCGCSSRSLSGYHHDGPDGSIEDLPAILPLAELRDGAFEVANIDEWYRLAHEYRLVGKHLDDAIGVYGEHYLIWDGDPQGPRAYYKLAGTHSWGVYGVLVLDERLRITKVTTDPG